MKITIITPEIKELEANAAAWEKRCEELEQELREKNEHLSSEIRRRQDACQDCADRETEIRELRDRIGELDYTIAVYDDENRRLKARLGKEEETALETEFPAPFETSLTPLNDWAKRIHEIAVKHGWWAQPPMAAANSRAGRENAENGASPEAGADRFADDDKPFPEIVALCHSELSEALEEYRDGMPMAYQVDGKRYYPALNRTEPNTVEDVCKWRDDKKPEGVAVEMLDCMIRILDWCGHEGIDVDTLMEKKAMYNKNRPYRHGGKKA